MGLLKRSFQAFYWTLPCSHIGSQSMGHRVSVGIHFVAFFSPVPSSRLMKLCQQRALEEHGKRKDLLRLVLVLLSFHFSCLWLQFGWASRWGHPGGPLPYMDVRNKERPPLPCLLSQHPKSRPHPAFASTDFWRLDILAHTRHLDLDAAFSSAELWHSSLSPALGFYSNCLISTGPPVCLAASPSLVSHRACVTGAWVLYWHAFRKSLIPSSRAFLKQVTWGCQSGFVRAQQSTPATVLVSRQLHLTLKMTSLLRHMSD